MADHVFDVFVVCVRLEAQAVFERHCERNDHVQSANFGEEIFLSELWIGVAFFSVHPDETRKVLRHKGELGPIFTSLVVSLVGS